MSESKNSMANEPVFANLRFDIDRDIATKYRNEFNLGGLCCAFAMDYAKKRLANKTIDETTYKDDGRIKKIAKRHALQDGRPGGIEKVAAAFGLTMGNSIFQFGWDKFGDEEHLGNDKAFGVFYVSVSARNGGHGFAVDARGTALYLADEGAGIYQIQDSSLGAVVRKHLKLFKDNEVLDKPFAWCHPLTLK